MGGGWEGALNSEMDVREVSAYPVQRPRTPRPDSRRSRADLMAQALDSPCAVLTPLPHAPPHQMMRGSILLKPLGYFTSILSPSCHHRFPPPPPALSGISEFPPPSAGSEPPKGRLPSPLVQFTSGRGAGLGKRTAQLGATHREPLPLPVTLRSSPRRTS